ncbi:MAG: Spy/CpxP family protein refolding chaperone [Agarilytica sp.]
MKIYTLLMCCVAALVLTGPALAKGMKHGHEGHKMHWEMHQVMVEKELDLTDDQKTKVAEIRKEYKKKLKELHQGPAKEKLHSLDPGDAKYKKKVKKFAKQRAAQVEAHIVAKGEMRVKIYEVLTEDQRKAFKDLKNKAHNKKKLQHKEKYEHQKHH